MTREQALLNLKRFVDWAERRFDCEVCGGAYFRFNQAIDHRDDCLVPMARESLDKLR